MNTTRQGLPFIIEKKGLPFTVDRKGLPFTIDRKGLPFFIYNKGLTAIDDRIGSIIDRNSNESKITY